MRALRSRTIPLLVTMIAVLLMAVLGLSVKAFAWQTRSPAFQTAEMPTKATFRIPNASHDSWTLNLWSHGQLIGSETGSAGTLSVPVSNSQCGFQADVRENTPTGKGRYYSGSRVLAPCCPPSSPS
jgi:hypothetical protein